MTDVDVLGIGLGARHLALGLALREHNDRVGERARVRMLFVDRDPGAATRLAARITPAGAANPAADLVTARDPSSPWSLRAFLHRTGGLAGLADGADLSPADVGAYLRWCHGALGSATRLGVEATHVVPPDLDGGRARVRLTGPGPGVVAARRVLLPGARTSSAGSTVHRLVEAVRDAEQLARTLVAEIARSRAASLERSSR